MKIKFLPILVLLILNIFAAYANAESIGNIYQATLAESNPKTPEISTEEMQTILEEKSALLLIPAHPKNTLLAIFQAQSISPRKMLCRRQITRSLLK